jgi:hypothetical protein
MSTKTYLGDAVYAELEAGMVKLIAEDGISATNTIYLEPEVIDALLSYIARARERKPRPRRPLDIT